MRLIEKEVAQIQQVFKDVFEEGEIYLFGSRVNDTQKGGDIDLFIVSKENDGLLEKKLDFLALLKQKIGDQKIDVVISKNPNRLIEQEALTKGIRLCKI